MRAAMTFLQNGAFSTSEGISYQKKENELMFAVGRIENNCKDAKVWEQGKSQGFDKPVQT